MEVLYLVFADGDLIDIDYAAYPKGWELNRGARRLLRKWRAEYDDEELRCSIYLLTERVRRLAFVGEEILEGLHDN